jgi:hypothetical protein
VGPVRQASDRETEDTAEMSDGFISIGATFNILAGVFLLVYWYAYAIFLPYRKLTTTISILVQNRNWTWINALGVLGALLGLLGQGSILVIQGYDSSPFVYAGFYIAVAGTTLLIGTMLWETVLWPLLYRHDESLLDFNGPLYSSRTFIGFFILSGLIFAIGYVFVGVGIMQVGILPWTAGLLLAIGAPIFGLGAMFGKYQVVVRSVGVTLMSAGSIWLGLSMLS